MKHLFTALIAGSTLLFSASATENLLKNGDFKTKKNWNLWQSGKKTEWPGTGKIGEGKIEMQSVKNGCFTQKIKVQPGETYVYTVTGSNTSKGKATIALAFLDASSKWIKGDQRAQLPASGREETVTVTATVPENGAYMSVQLSAANQPKEDTGVITFTKADLQKK